MLLVFLIVLAQSPAGRGPAVVSDTAWLHSDLVDYLSVATSYGSANYGAALREIRRWPPRRIGAAVNTLRQQSRNLRPSATAPGDIAFGTVEAAVLMHMEAALLALQTLRLAEAEVHLKASTTLFEWSRVAAAEARNWVTMRRFAFEKSFGQQKPAPEIRERIDGRDFYVVLAAGALANGFPDTALPLAEKARLAAPLDPEVQLVFGCVAESLAEQERLRHRESEAAAARDEAEGALRDALALDGGLLEARLHLGKLHLERGRLIEAEPLLHEVAASSGDDRRRYLARLFLGRLAERRGRLDEAAGFYLLALEAWPDSQAARFGLGHAVEKSSGPAAALPLVEASLAASQRRDRAADPWWIYLFGPPGVAKDALDRVWKETLDR